MLCGTQRDMYMRTEKMRKTWEVLGRKLVFRQLWGPLDDSEQNGTQRSFQKIIWY